MGWESYILYTCQMRYGYVGNKSGAARPTALRRATQERSPGQFPFSEKRKNNQQLLGIPPRATLSGDIANIRWAVDMVAK